MVGFRTFENLWQRRLSKGFYKENIYRSIPKKLMFDINSGMFYLTYVRSN